jgi:hypothetical protein
MAAVLCTTRSVVGAGGLTPAGLGSPDPLRRTSVSAMGKGEPSPAEMIDGRIRELGDWRGEMLARLRALIKQAIPEVVEEWKWRR